MKLPKWYKEWIVLTIVIVLLFVIIKFALIFYRLVLR